MRSIILNQKEQTQSIILGVRFMNNLKRMLEEKGLRLLDFASPSYLPGHLIKIHYFWKPGDFGPETRLNEDRGLATDVLKTDALALTPRVPADIVVANVTDQFYISSGAGFPQFGLTASGNIKHGVAITWNISAVETVEFGSQDRQTYFNTVLPNLREQAHSDPKKYGWVRECFVLKQVFFAQTISGTIHTTGTIDGKTAFGQAGVTTTGNLSINWSADETTFVVQGSNQVPFAARGDPVG
jgi:hypothetical protein